MSKRKRDKWVELKDGEDLFIRGNDFCINLREIQSHRVLDLSISVDKAASLTPIQLTKKLLLYPDARFRTVRLQAHGVRDDEKPDIGKEVIILDRIDPDKVVETIEVDNLDELLER